MNRPCSRSSVLLEELRKGELSAESLKHLSVCEICSDAWIQNHLQEQFRGAPELERLPRASLVWWKAEVIAKREALHRSGAFLRIATICYLAFGALLLGWLAVWLWETLGIGHSLEISAVALPVASTLLGFSALTLIALWIATRNVRSFRIRS